MKTHAAEWQDIRPKMSEDSFSIGDRVGERYKNSVIDQLSAIAAKAGVRVSSLTEGGYSSGPASRYSGAGRGRSGSGRTPGQTYHAKPEPAYHGEPVLGEGVAADTDAAKAIREGFESAQDSKSHISHGAGTKSAALPDAARDPNAARAAAVQAAQDAGESFSGAASTYNPFKPGWKSGGPETASGERYSETDYTAAVQQQLAQKLWPGGKMGYGDKYAPRYVEATDPKRERRLSSRVDDIMLTRAAHLI